MPTFATAQFKRFFDCGRAVRWMLPLGAGRFMHLVVLYGYQGADADPEQLALANHLFDAALGELGVVARGQPCMLVGDFNVEPTKNPLLGKRDFGLGSGLISRFLGRWPLVGSLHPPASGIGVLVVVLVVILWLGALLLLPLCCLARFRLIGGFSLILLFRTLFDYDRWSCRVTQPVRFSPLWPASWLPAVTRVGGLSLLRSRGFGRCMMIVCSSCLGRMVFFWLSLLDAGECLSGLACLVWCC